MAKTTDELFAEATEADYETAEPVTLAASDTEEEFQFRIDEHLRTIAIPEKGVVAGVEGDLNVNIARFVMVRYYHGRDLSKLNIRINYRNANGQVNYYTVSDATVSGNNIVFSWEYAADVTQYKGNVQFVVYLFSTTNAVLKQRFFSTLGTLEVLEGLEVDSSIPASEQTDILLHLKKDLSAYAEEVKKSLPADYTAMTEQVSSLKEDIDSYNSYNIISRVEKYNTTMNAIKFMWDSNLSCTITGTSTNESYVNLINSKNMIPEYLQLGKSYKVIMNSENVYFRVYNWVNDKNNLLFETNGIDSFVLPLDSTGVLIRLLVKSGVTINETVSPIFYNALSNTDLENEINFIKPDFSDKKIVFYGDSITALGNDFHSGSWQEIVKKYFGLKNVLSVGIGGTGFKWTDSRKYTYPSQTSGASLPLKATAGADGEYCDFCSWLRIVRTVPKDSDIVFVMGGTNDINVGTGSNQMSADNTTDKDWINSSLYTGGDYDVSKLTGGILSTIMKLRKRCPNALIILCTPLGGRGQTQGQNELNQDRTFGQDTFDIANEIIKQSRYMSTMCIDLYANCGITPYNRGTYIKDLVHPNETNGTKAIARYIIQEFRKIILLH